MALSKELNEYSSKIMKELCSNQKVVDLLNDNTDTSAPDRSLMYDHIYPYAYIPDKTEEAKSFICFRIYVYEVPNKTIKKMSIMFYAFCHQSLVRTEEGLRYYLLAEEIESMFNESQAIGAGRLKLETMESITPITNWHGVTLEYSVAEFNCPTINGSR